MPNGDPRDVGPDTVDDTRVLAYIKEFTTRYSFWFLPPGTQHNSRTHLRPWPACGHRHEGLMELVRYLMAWDARIELLKAAQQGLERQAWVHFLRDDVGGAARDIARQCRYGHNVDSTTPPPPQAHGPFRPSGPAERGPSAPAAARRGSFERVLWSHVRKSEQGLGE